MPWLPRVLCALALVIGCSERPPTVGPRNPCTGHPSELICDGDRAIQCSASSRVESQTDCSLEAGTQCHPDRGCLRCIPGTSRCVAEGALETLERCSSDGLTWSPQTSCDTTTGARCSPEGCRDLCSDATAERSYVGCEYWPVTTSNSLLEQEFELVVAVANPQLVEATVVIERAGGEVARREVPAGELVSIPLPWVESLRTPPGLASVRVTDGAYRLTSDVPVVVTQFNPLEYRIARDCASGDPFPNNGECFSYTNDASLLIPSHVLTGSYVVVSRPTFALGRGDSLETNPGFAAIIGVRAEPVQVEVVSSAYVAGSTDGTIPSLVPGETFTVSLALGEVLQLASAGFQSCPGESRVIERRGESFTFCDPGPEYDLTGTLIRADGPVALVSGHDCTFVPFDTWACDHLEEQIFPVESLGTSALVSRTRPHVGEPNLLRVVSAGDGNTLQFEPAIAEQVTLDRGEWIEVEMSEAVRIDGTQPFLAASYMVGQEYDAGMGVAPLGDPSMGLAVPDAQFRFSYVFLAPSSYTQRWVDIIAPSVATVSLDGVPIETEGTAIGVTRWVTRTVMVRAGTHRIEGSLPIGITVYGFGQFTSYLASGGLDFRMIAPPF